MDLLEESLVEVLQYYYDLQYNYNSFVLVVVLEWKVDFESLKNK